MQVNTIYEGDALEILKQLPDACVDSVMTSPPYWSLRDYGKQAETIWDGKPDCKHSFEQTTQKAEGYNNTRRRWQHGATRKNEPKNWSKQIKKYAFCKKCGAWKGQLGLEKDFDLFIKHLCDIFDEVKRVLKKQGTCWINLSDTYSQSGGAGNQYFSFSGKNRTGEFKKYAGHKAKNLPPKCLCLIPFRFAIEMVNRGWTLRNVIIWHKRNCMPSSAKDRFTVDFEYLFMFSKNQKYYFEQQFEPAKPESVQRLKRAVSANHKRLNSFYKQGLDNPRPNRSTKIPKQSAESFGSPRARYHRDKEEENVGKDNNRAISTHSLLNQDYLVAPFDIKKGSNKRCVWTINTKPFPEAHFAVYPEALCEIPIKAGCPKGGIVLDPFIGSGTTALAALKLNRNFIGIEINPEYVKIATKRIKPFLEQKKLTKDFSFPGVRSTLP